MARLKGKGIGKRVAIYVPVEDEPILAMIAKRLKLTRKEGFRTSFSFEVIRLLKVALGVAK